jgi:hypothetical protein
MPNTTNYSFPTPADTDLVKNGADAIRDLGDAVDTAMNTALGTKKAGMVLLNTTSFSAVASQSINDVFSSTYTNYKFLINVNSASDDGYLLMRLRVAGADNSGTNYHWHFGAPSSTGNTYTGYGAATQSSIRLTTGNSTTNVKNIDATIFNPFASFATLLTWGNAYTSGAGAAPVAGGAGAGLFAGATSFTGLTIFPSAGTMTGSISVYGVNI